MFSFTDSSDKRRLRSQAHNFDDHEDRLYSNNYFATLEVFNNRQNCLLEDGYYEVLLKHPRNSDTSEMTKTEIAESLKKNACWQSVGGGRRIEAFELSTHQPTISFRVQWSNDPEMTNRSSPITRQHKLNGSLNIREQKKPLVTNNNSNLATAKKIFYQFMYTDSTRQHTESGDNLNCPWCHIKCPAMYSLLKHLRLCHPRFLFTFTDNPKGAKIDVVINHCYDAYLEIGSVIDIHSNTGISKSRFGPTKKKPTTSLLVSGPTRPSYQMSEFFDRDVDNCRRLVDVVGHNRLYYHSATCRPVDEQEAEEDSEEENDPQWLRTKMHKMISDFSDVNEDEKKMMILWNLHMMPGKYTSDSSMVQACEDLIRKNINELIPLQRNFILHLSNMYDFGLLDAEKIRSIMKVFCELKKDYIKPPEPKRRRSCFSPSKFYSKNSQ